jgi:hypothetical protein
VVCVKQLVIPRTIRLEIFYHARCREVIIAGLEHDRILHLGKRGKRPFRRRIPEKPIRDAVRPIPVGFQTPSLIPRDARLVVSINEPSRWNSCRKRTVLMVTP